MSTVGHPNAAAILRALAEQHKRELQDIYWQILVDGSLSAESDRLWWADLTDPNVISVLAEIEVASWLAAVEAFWLDKSLEHGFPAPDAEDG